LAPGPAHACFLSEYLRRLHEEAGISFASAEVIHGGVRVDRFHEPRRTPPDPAGPLRLLYAGQVTPDRGLHTVIEAITRLPPGIQAQVKLTVAGGGQDAYVSKVKAQVRSAGLTDRVSFMGKVSHVELPAVYKSHDVFVFASSRQEGFGFVVVEAMLAGCAVLTTGSGGSQEIARAADLPQFSAGDARALSDLLATLVGDRAELHRIAVKGQAVALREFTFDRMMEKWNASLRRFPASRSGTADDGPHGSAR
jgi:glycosyltransferase involved in cell wall biosynthesis